MSTRFATLTLAAALSLGAATGCRPALVPLTQEMREQNHLTDGELKNLQYYVSHTITLRRELDSGGRQVTGNHKLVLVNGKTIEEVVVEAHTPGICVGVDAHRLSVSFEQGTSFTFVPAHSRGMASPGGFASPPEVDPFPGNNQHRSVASTDGLFSGGYVIWTEPSGSVLFMGRKFDGIEETPKVTLLIDAESLEQVVKKHKVLPGMRLTTP